MVWLVLGLLVLCCDFGVFGVCLYLVTSGVCFCWTGGVLLLITLFTCWFYVLYCFCSYLLWVVSVVNCFGVWFVN